jgi:hypothetical protein
MFLYARLVLDYLSSNIFYSGDEMKESINELPEELFGLYVHIYLTVSPSTHYLTVLIAIRRS